MKRTAMYRIHEWAADRFMFIQYPGVRHYRPARAENDESVSNRVFWFSMRTLRTIVMIPVIAFLIFAIYCMIRIGGAAIG